MATPARYDIRLTAGDDWQITVRLRDSDPESSDGYIDTTGYTWAAEVRTAPLPRGTLVATMTATPIAGGVILALPASVTALFGERRTLVYDVQSSSPDVRTWLTGQILVTPEVTE
jgi:hypothetical protein